ncbi:TniQ family protein [Aeromonas jandaei]|uniref:TniQ family protein n=1 Tax=Aeromonas jandaei TaxID=650 RepID=UPI002AA0DA81|nr:TniQ family protein [Aeromonas jandaei]
MGISNADKEFVVKVRSTCSHLHQGFGMQYCPLCLGEDKEPYYRLSWRLAFYTFCPRHQTLLLDRCHACGAPVAFHRIEQGRPRRYDTPSLNECWKCQTQTE